MAARFLGLAAKCIMLLNPEDLKKNMAIYPRQGRRLFAQKAKRLFNYRLGKHESLYESR